MKVSHIFAALALTWMIALTFSVALGLYEMGALSFFFFAVFGLLTGMAEDIYDNK